jgi:hypothetical protein
MLNLHVYNITFLVYQDIAQDRRAAGGCATQVLPLWLLNFPPPSDLRYALVNPSSGAHYHASAPGSSLSQTKQPQIPDIFGDRRKSPGALFSDQLD